MSLRAVMRDLVLAFAVSRRAASAVEFALVLPFLLILGGGVYETSRAIAASRHLNNAASSIANILATNGVGTVTYQDLGYARDSTMLSLPEVLGDAKRQGIAWTKDVSIAMAGISFTPLVLGCTSGCTYLANVNWTTATLAVPGRLCLSLQTSASDTSQPTYTSLPASLFTAVPQPSGGNAPPPFLIAIDMTYQWTPLIFTSSFFKNIIGPITFKRSAFINPRYTNKIAYSVIAGDDGTGHQCLGF